MRHYQYNLIDMKKLLKHRYQTNWIACNIWHKQSLSITLKDLLHFDENYCYLNIQNFMLRFDYPEFDDIQVFCEIYHL